MNGFLSHAPCPMVSLVGSYPIASHRSNRGKPYFGLRVQDGESNGRGSKLGEGDYSSREANSPPLDYPFQSQTVGMIKCSTWENACGLTTPTCQTERYDSTPHLL
jgi:hypothetical protein